MRTVRKISIIVLLLTTVLWSSVPAGLVLAAEEQVSGNQSEPRVVQLETPIENVPIPTELDNSGNEPIDIKPIIPKPIKPVKPIDDRLIPDNLSPTDRKLVPDEREPRDPLDEENPVDTYADRDNAGLQPKNNGQYSVDEFTGVFSYSYPIQIPAGRNGLQPQLALQYNHRLNNIGSMVGVGWQLMMPSVERSNRTGIDNLYTDNYFRLNLGGSDDLVAINVDASGYGSYGKQIESDFLKIEFASSSNAWIVTDKLGVTYTFGSTSASRQDNPVDSSKIYKWLLEEVRDTNDNFVRYEYYKDSGQIYPQKIFYTGHGTTDGIFEIDFEPFANGTPAENNVQNISYQTGFGVETKYLLNNIDIKINNNLVTRYDLDLNLNSNDNKYLLNRIIPRFYQDGVDYVKDQVEFDYSESVNTYKEGEGYELPYPLGVSAGLNSSKRDMFIDLNGDSYTDYLRFLCTSGTVSLSVWLNDTEDGWATSTAYGVAQAETGITCGALYGTSYTMPISFGNINGDHFIDMITDDLVYYNTGSNWDTASTTLPITLYHSANNNGAPLPKIFFQDMNADGYDDIVYEHHPSNTQSDVDVYIKDQLSGEWNLDNNFHLSINMVHDVCLRYGGTPFDFADLNNDGLLDVFYKYYCVWTSSGGYDPEQGENVYINTGENFSETEEFNAPTTPSYYSITSETISQQIDYFTDLNNDSIQDYGQYNKSKWATLEGQNHWSRGMLFLNGNQLFDTGNLESYDYFDKPLPVAVSDINGDQIQDAIHNPSENNFHIYYGQGIKPDILTEVDYQSGAKVNVYYESSTKEKDAQGNLLNPDLPFDLQVVKEVIVNSGQQEWQGYQYEYQNGNTTSYLDQNLKDVYGFSEVSVKSGKAMPDIDFGTGVDGNYISSGNETWTVDKNFTSLTIQSGHVITVEPEVVIKVQGDVIIDGILTAQGKGYAGGRQVAWGGQSGFGPGGGGGGYGGIGGTSSFGAGGGGYSEIGQNGQGCQPGYCTGGSIYGDELLESLDKGSGGGGSGDIGYVDGSDGGTGGGIIQLFAYNIVINGEINADGNDGEDGQMGTNLYAGGAGGGSGGSIYIKSLEEVQINGSIHANGGEGGSGGYFNNGGDGANGRIRIESPVINGDTSPVYYTKGDFDYSIDNTPIDNDLQKQINYYHTASNDDLYLHGKPKVSEKYDVNDNLLTKTFTSWQEEDLNNNRKFVYNSLSSNTDLTTTTAISIAKQYTYDLTNGNLLTEDDLGKVELNINTGQITDELIGDEKQTTYDYAYNSNEHILAAPKTKVISDDSDSKQQNLYYDNLPLGQVNSVNLTKEDYIVNQVDVDRLFNSYGLVTRQTDPKGFNTNITYDIYNLYPTQTTNPLNQVSQTQYNLFNGQVATSTSPNGLITVNKYDAFGRLAETKVSNPDSPTQLLTKKKVIYGERPTSEVYQTFWSIPTSHGLYNNLFTNPQNGYVIDGSYATRYDGGAPGAGLQSYEGFNINIPSKAIITGIEFTVSHKVDNTTAVSEWISYYSPSENEWSDPIYLTVSTTNHEDNVGSSIFLPVNLTLEDISSNNFSVKYIGSRNAEGQTTWFLDGLKMKLFYGLPIRYAEVHNYFDANNYTISREYRNGLDQVIQKKAQMANQDEYSTVDIDYDSLGRVSRQSLPYITTNLDYTAPDLQQAAKTYTYDALDRVLTETTPVGTTSYEYDGLTTKIYDANNHRKDLTKDAYGNLIEVKEYNDSEIYTTSYEYNLTNQLTKIIDAQGNERNFIYDALGNLTSQDMVHVSGAQNTPVMTYAYDKNGNVSIKTNFNGQTTYYSYDKLNRPTAEKQSGLYQVLYAYDQGVQANIGQLTQVDYLGGNRQNYNYDILGRVTDYDALIEGTTYNLDYDYNLGGQLLAIDYPDGKQVSYNLNNLGQVDAVVYNNGQTQTTLADNISYNVNGQLATFSRNNGYQTNYNYNPDQNYRLTNLSSTDGQNSVQDIEYSYDPVGNIIQLVDSSGGDLDKTVTYTYDDLNRLLSAESVYTNNTSSDYAITYEYDPVGNMTYNSELGTLEYNYDQPHQLSEANNITYTYDPAGNLLDNGNATFTWDYRNRLKHSLDSSEYPVYYQYDSNNQRLVKTQFKDDGQGGIGTLLSQNHYLDKYFEENLVDNNTKDHIFLNGLKLATINNDDDPYFIIGDHLNSSSILVDSQGNIAEVSDYKPYGTKGYNNQISDLGDDYTFTGKEYDDENGLQYYGARYLDNNIGKFISIEPVMLVLHDGNQLKAISGQELQKVLSDPQSLNSYTYSRNNPIILVDVDGNWWKELFTGQQSLSDFQVELGQAAQYMYDNNGVAKTAMDHPGYTGLAVGVVGGAGAAALAQVAMLGVSGTAAETLLSTCLFNCSNILKYGNSSIQLLGNYSTAYYNKLQSQYSEFVRKGVEIGEHALNKMNNKQFTPDQVINAFNSGAKYFDTKEQNFNIISNGIRISLDPNNVNRIIQVLDIKNITDRFIKL